MRGMAQRLRGLLCQTPEVERCRCFTRDRSHPRLTCLCAQLSPQKNAIFQQFHGCVALCTNSLNVFGLAKKTVYVQETGVAITSYAASFRGSLLDGHCHASQRREDPGLDYGYPMYCITCNTEYII